MPEQSDPEQFRKIFIGGVSYDTTDETLKKYFEKYGEVMDCIVMREPVTKKSRGFGFVTFRNSSSVDQVQSERPHVIDGKEVESKRAVPRSHNTPEAHVTVKKIFVGGLKEELSQQDIQDYFAQFGAVEHVEMKYDKDSGKQRGFCFVTFDDYDPVDKCVLLRNHTINNIQVETKKALGRNEIGNMMAGLHLGIGRQGPMPYGMNYFGPTGPMAGFGRGGFGGGGGGGGKPSGRGRGAAGVGGMPYASQGGYGGQMMGSAGSYGGSAQGAAGPYMGGYPSGAPYGYPYDEYVFSGYMPGPMNPYMNYFNRGGAHLGRGGPAGNGGSMRGGYPGGRGGNKMTGSAGVGPSKAQGNGMPSPGQQVNVGANFANHVSQQSPQHNMAGPPATRRF